MLSNNTNKVQCKENAATKEEQTPHSDDENISDSNIEGKRNECSEPSKEQWTDRNKSRTKRKISVYLNEMNEPIALEPELKSLEKLSKSSKVSKSSKIFKNIEKKILERQHKI